MYFLFIIFDFSNFLIWIIGICNGWDLITLYEFGEGAISAIMKFLFIDKF